ncbi:MAG: hypothetical protein IPL95_05825 [Saprospiraceae bacterium]|nr:hypothetical protein [Saprospiraceae bacterium]
MGKTMNKERYFGSGCHRKYFFFNAFSLCGIESKDAIVDYFEINTVSDPVWILFDPPCK